MVEGHLFLSSMNEIGPGVQEELLFEDFSIFVSSGHFVYRSRTVLWPGLGLPRPKAIVVIPKNQPLPKHFRKKTSKSEKHACHYAKKKTR